MQFVVQLAHEMMLAPRSAMFTPWTTVGTSSSPLERRGENDEPGPGLSVAREVRCMCEHAGALQDNVDGQVAPGQLVQVLLVQGDTGAAVDDEAAALGSNVAPVPAVDGVVLQQIGQLVRRDEVIDRCQLERPIVEDLLERGTPDPSHSIDGDPRHDRLS
jgi:hypothetical protein